MASPADSRPSSPRPSQLPPVPSSPVYSMASTANRISQYGLPPPPAPRPLHPVLRQSDLQHSHEAYADLLASAKAYRLALASLSAAASSFGSALESCARLKEARAEPIGPPAAPSLSAAFSAKLACSADTLLSASGVHHLIANHQQILSETVYRSFEVPLLHDLDKWQTVMQDEEDTYRDKIQTQSRELKRLEAEGLKLHKQKRRDVARFRAHLVDLTSKLDGLTTIHADHSRSLLRESQHTSGHIAEASCSLVRAELDIFEGLARKGWTGGGLDDLLDKGRDLLAAEEAGVESELGDGSHLFSILPPRSILADGGLDLPRPDCARGSSLRTDEAEGYQSLAAVASDAAPPGDGETVVAVNFNRPRNARPFSPHPIRRVPADVTLDSLSAMMDSSAGQGPDIVQGAFQQQMPGSLQLRPESDDGQTAAEAEPQEGAHWRDALQAEAEAVEGLEDEASATAHD